MVFFFDTCPFKTLRKCNGFFFVFLTLARYHDHHKLLILVATDEQLNVVQCSYSVHSPDDVSYNVFYISKYNDEAIILRVTVAGK